MGGTATLTATVVSGSGIFYIMAIQSGWIILAKCYGDAVTYNPQQVI
jgi:hypothetical protein